MADRPSIGRGAPVVREVFFPAAVTEIVDTWESTGLRGTASHDYVVRDIFVPASHSMWFAEPPACDRPLYRMPTVAMFATFVAAVPLGIARHTLDEFILLAGEKVPVLSTVALADKPQAQDRLGRAYALVAAGRRFLSGTLSDLWRAVQAGRAPTEADRGRLWLAAAHAAHGALEAVELLYTAAGASSVYSRSPLDRCLRDARTAVQHICTQELHYELTGRLLLGRAPGPSPWAVDDRSQSYPPTEGASQ